MSPPWNGRPHSECFVAALQLLWHGFTKLCLFRTLSSGHLVGLALNQPQTSVLTLAWLQCVYPCPSPHFSFKRNNKIRMKINHTLVEANPAKLQMSDYDWWKVKTTCQKNTWVMSHGVCPVLLMESLRKKHKRWQPTFSEVCIASHFIIVILDCSLKVSSLLFLVWQ